MKEMNLPDDNERLDALDELLIREMGHQAQWRQTMLDWEARQRRQRRLRLMPVISNVLSVAALMILGFILQALIPQTKLTDEAASHPLLPTLEQLVKPDSTSTTTSSAVQP